MKDLRLRLRKRSSDETGSRNLFARLSPHAAQDLHRLACQQAASRGLEQSGWVISEGLTDECESGVAFLPLQVVFPNGEVVYVSYNGGNVQDEGDTDYHSETTLPIHHTSRREPYTNEYDGGNINGLDDDGKCTQELECYYVSIACYSARIER
jgi:hypothetical protein